MKCLLLEGSLRKDSINRTLLDIVQDLLTKERLTHCEHIAFSSLDIPIYNADIQEKGFPKDIQSYSKTLSSNDAWIIVTPEYNGSIPGGLKNFIDWLSRLKPSPLKGKHVLLLSASPALAGGTRGLLATRLTLDMCGCFVYPGMFSLSAAFDQINAEKKLVNPDLENNLNQLLHEFIAHVKASSH